MRHLFFDRDARLLLVGQGLSLFGDRAMYLVLGIWVKTLTGSNTAGRARLLRPCDPRA